MKILLVDNNSKYKSKLLKSLKPHKITIQPYRKIKNNYNKFDAIILSGGHSYSTKNHPEKYSKEINLIKNSKAPILGICLGFELIASHLMKLSSNFQQKKTNQK